MSEHTVIKIYHCLKVFAISLLCVISVLTDGFRKVDNTLNTLFRDFPLILFVLCQLRTSLLLNTNVSMLLLFYPHITD